MPEFVAISRNRHASRYWNKPVNYQFTRQDNVAFLQAREAPTAMVAAPLGFFRMQDHYLLVMVQGLGKTNNLLVGDDGRWLGPYVPASYRQYPFALLPDDKGQQMLCIDEASGCISEEWGEPFFDAEGAPSPRLKEILAEAQQYEEDRKLTLQICALLQKHELIEPWPVALEDEGGSTSLEGLYRIDEKRLRQLEAGALQELMQTGALLIAYSQLLSMQQLQRLAKAQAQQARRAAEPRAQLAPGLKLVEDNGIISFENLR